jgi:hypothetical protein
LRGSTMWLAVTGARCWWRSWLRHCATSRKVAGSIPDYVIGNFGMDISYTRVLHIKVAYRVPHKWRHAFYGHTAAAMRAHNVLCNSYDSRDKPLQLSSCTICVVVHCYSFENCIAYFYYSKLVYHGTPNTHRCTTHPW